MNKKALLVPLVAALFAVPLTHAEEWWEIKPYTEWSEKEVKKILFNSNWSKVHTVTINNTQNALTRGFEGTGGGDLQREQQNFFHIRFLTAKPIRMAIARQKMLENPELMDQRRLAGLQRFVEQPDDTHIIVSMTLTSQPPGALSLRDYQTALAQLRTAQLVANTTLATGSGTRVFVVDYMPPDHRNLGALYFFPRQLEDGTPVLKPGEKEIRFETFLSNTRVSAGTGDAPVSAGFESTGNFGNTPNASTRSDRIWRQFKLDKMLFKGKLEI